MLHRAGFSLCIRTGIKCLLCARWCGEGSKEQPTEKQTDKHRKLQLYIYYNYNVYRL